MLRLIYLTTLYLSCIAEPKAPRIYNVLISSKKNLSPSQALPVYEPVIRTVGYYPPLTIYSTLGQPYRVIPQYTVNTYTQYGNSQVNPDNQYSEQVPESRENVANIQNRYGPLTNYTTEILKHGGRFEMISQPQKSDDTQSGSASQQPKYSIPRPENFPSLAQETDPKHAIANLRQKSDIPDVPPPPLPVRTKSSS